MRYRIVAIISLILFLPFLIAGKETDPDLGNAVRTVRAFYQFHFKHDMGFTEKTIRQKQRWFEASFYQLLLEEAKRGAAATDEAPDLEGDPFTNSQEYPDSFQVGKAVRSGEQVNVEIIFVWKHEKRKGQVLLVKQKNRLLISNIIYDDFDLLKFLNRADKS
jgi:hypothetical protein